MVSAVAVMGKPARCTFRVRGYTYKIPRENRSDFELLIEMVRMDRAIVRYSDNNANVKAQERKASRPATFNRHLDICIMLVNESIKFLCAKNL